MVQRRKSRAKPGPYRYRRGERIDYTERDQAICEQRAQGISLATIGAPLGLSGERVRQIVWKHERKRNRRLSPRLEALREAFAKGVGSQK